MLITRWVHIKIADSIFRNVKLCTRCNYTTVDPDTGRKTSDMGVIPSYYASLNILTNGDMYLDQKMKGKKEDYLCFRKKYK